MAYKALLFDLDNTLIDFTQSEKLSLDKLHATYFSKHIENVSFKKSYHRINKKLWLQAEAGKTTPGNVKTDRFKLLNEELKLKLDCEQLAADYEDSLGEHSAWFPGVEEALISLKKHYQIGIITNGLARAQAKKYIVLNLARMCECYLVSEVLGIAKPAKEIFAMALTHFNIGAHEALMIGDSIPSDYQGALNAGIDFCWINNTNRPIPKHLPRPKHMIASVAQLSPLIL